MKKWILKAIVQKGISYLPYASKWNFLFQKYVTKGVFLSDEYFGNKITHARDHLSYFKKFGGAVATKTFLELGTGWYPVVPLALFLSEAGPIYSLDITPWMTLDRIKTTLEKYKEWDDRGLLKEYLPNKSEEKWQQLLAAIDMDWASMDDICTYFNIIPLVADARETPLESGSIDFICSNNTFEHIYPGILGPILKDFQRLLKKDGVMSHFIDMSDHFAHFDHSINIYNFLQYAESTWNWIDNTIQPQNRMRFMEYKKMYGELEIPIIEEDFRPGDLVALDTITLAAPFDQYPKKEVAISHGYLVSKWEA